VRGNAQYLCVKCFYDGRLRFITPVGLNVVVPSVRLPGAVNCYNRSTTRKSRATFRRWPWAPAAQATSGSPPQVRICLACELRCATSCLPQRDCAGISQALDCDTDGVNTCIPVVVKPRLTIASS
jgi:hypothetical protein